MIYRMSVILLSLNEELLGSALFPYQIIVIIHSRIKEYSLNLIEWT